ncbi:hypothetical protein Athai_50150 [Actinocatenispora thailandica]|uniref:Uncharacterized protein n=1 Tax=Actinocatenispora thailandica TaxID=227318 RepID=A0A7R7DTF7_9ACTN|nr:hypothetical protein [Actinocatenispora thailandica]BCJ37512.1 hypothetical protein Athai_50150 [Actinocatenispora thailandica]
MTMAPGGAPGRAPGRRRIRRSLIVLIVGLAVLVLVAAVVGIGAVTGLFGPTSHPPVNPAPWADGARIRPVRSTDPQVRSVLRAQQYEIAWRSVVTGLGQQQVDQEYTFDPDQRRGESPAQHRRGSYLAGLSVYPHGTSTSTSTSSASASTGTTDSGAEGSDDIHVGEYGRSSDALAALRDDRSGESLRRVSSPAIDGASHVSAWQGKSLSAPCRPKAGKPISVAVDAVVDGRVALSITNGCASSADGGEQADALLAIARKAVRAIETVRSQPVPATWMPGTASVPIISSGGWYQSQLQVSGRRDGLNVQPLLDEPFADSGVDTVFYGKDTVYAYADRAAAHAVLGKLPGMSTDYRYQQAPHRVGAGAGDERLCARGEHWQQGTTCWSRVGRFVVVQSYGTDGKADATMDETQVKALRGVH